MSLNPAAKTTSNSYKAVSVHKITKNYSSTNHLPQLLHLLRVRLRWRAEVELSVFGVELFVFKLHSAGSSGGLCLQPQGLAVTNGQLAFSRSGSSTPSPWSVTVARKGADTLRVNQSQGRTAPEPGLPADADGATGRGAAAGTSRQQHTARSQPGVT